MKIIGLDIGSYSVKAIEVEMGLRQLEILDFFEEKLPLTLELPKPEVVKEAIKNIFLKNNIVPPYKVISSLSGLFVSSRIITLPFADKSKIKQTLPFELEEHIPFALEDIVFDYQILAKGEKNTTLLTLITPKDIIQERLSLFEIPESSPDLLTMDAISLFNLTKFNWEEPGEVYALVNIGRSQTALCIVDDGKINHVRSISIAGQAITQTIQENYKLSFEDAEKAKIDNGFVLTDTTNVTADQAKFSECIKKALDPLIGQLNQTFQSNRSKGHGVVRKLFLSGGSSLLRNLPAYLSQELSLEVVPLKILNSYTMNNIADNDENNAKVSTVLSLALGCVGRNYSEQFNFRKGEFSKYQAGPLGKEVRYLLGMGGLIIAILFVTVFVIISFNNAIFIISPLGIALYVVAILLTVSLTITKAKERRRNIRFVIINLIFLLFLFSIALRLVLHEKTILPIVKYNTLSNKLYLYSALLAIIYFIIFGLIDFVKFIVERFKVFITTCKMAR